MGKSLVSLGPVVCEHHGTASGEVTAGERRAAQRVAIAREFLGYALRDGPLEHYELRKLAWDCGLRPWIGVSRARRHRLAEIWRETRMKPYPPGRGRLMWRLPAGGLACLLALHGPDGGALWVEGSAIQVVQPAAPHQDHIARGTQTIVYVGGRAFGVVERAADVMRLRTECGPPARGEIVGPGFSDG